MPQRSLRTLRSHRHLWFCRLSSTGNDKWDNSPNALRLRRMERKSWKSQGVALILRFQPPSSVFCAAVWFPVSSVCREVVDRERAKVRGTIKKGVADAGKTKAVWLKDRDPEKKKEAEMEVEEVRISWRLSLWETEIERIRNESLRGTAHGTCLEVKPQRTEMVWMCPKEDSENVGGRMLRMELEET